MFRYTDNFHYYWFIIKTDGIELGKKDCDDCTDSRDGQQFLVSKPTPNLKLNSWSNWKMAIYGNHIQVWVDEKKVIDYVDDAMSSKLASGNIAMYSENAYVQYDNINVTSNKK